MPSIIHDSIATLNESRTLEHKQWAQISTVELEDKSSSSPSERGIDEEHLSSYPWLVVSPYLEREHQLDLRTVDTPFRLLAIALTKLEKATNDYATTKYEDAFKWSDLMKHLKDLADREGYQWRRQNFYVVEFRSKLKQEIDNELLFKLDKKSHQEATAAGGLLKYWYGEPDQQRRNLATCLWRSKEDAVNGGKGPWHKQARACIVNMYESIDVTGVQLTIEDNVDNWHFERWSH